MTHIANVIEARNLPELPGFPVLLRNKHCVGVQGGTVSTIRRDGVRRRSHTSGAVGTHLQSSPCAKKSLYLIKYLDLNIFRQMDDTETASPARTE